MIDAVIMSGAKIKPVQRLKMRLGTKIAENPRNPSFYPTKTMACKGGKSGSGIPLNVLGGYRWPNSAGFDGDLLCKIIRAEIGAEVT